MIEYEETLQEEREGEFYRMLRNYIGYIVANPLEINIDDDCKEAIFKSCNEDYQYLLELFELYCEFLRIATPSVDDVNAFLKAYEMGYIDDRV